MTVIILSLWLVFFFSFSVPIFFVSVFSVPMDSMIDPKIAHFSLRFLLTVALLRRISSFIVDINSIFLCVVCALERIKTEIFSGIISINRYGTFKFQFSNRQDPLWTHTESERHSRPRNRGKENPREKRKNKNTI